MKTLNFEWTSMEWELGKEHQVEKLHVGSIRQKAVELDYLYYVKPDNKSDVEFVFPDQEELYKYIAKLQFGNLPIESFG